MKLRWLIVSLVVIALAGAPAAAAASQGIGPQHPFEQTSSKTPEQVSFVLALQNKSDLEQQVDAGMPAGALSVSQFAARYGQTQSNIAALESYLAGFGITSSAMANGLDVQTNGAAGQYNKALSVTQDDYMVTGPDGSQEVVHAPEQAPLLPPNLAQFVIAIVGLSNYPAGQSEALQAQVTAPSATGPGTPGNGDLTPSYFAAHYDLSPLLKHGATGAGRAVGIISLAGFAPSDAETFWNAVGAPSSPSRLQIVNVDGGSTYQDVETSLDVEQAGGVAPNASIRVYEAPNTWTGFVDAFFQAASEDTADAVTNSWGLPQLIIDSNIASGFLPSGIHAAFDEAFLELAAQGQSAFGASGDYGAFGGSNYGITNLEGWAPNQSPWITSAGGTTLPFDWRPSYPIVVTKERTFAWDYVFPYWQSVGGSSEASWAEQHAYGSGGGFNSDWPEPGYQQGVPGTSSFSAVTWLTPTDFQTIDGVQIADQWIFNSAPSVIQGTGAGRATPDLAANADPDTGYEVYDTQNLGGWGYYFGGTSFVAPQLAGSTAVIDSYLGRRVGFWNPSIYRFAMQSNSPFTPLDTSGVSNDNLYYTGTPGNVFNVGSGLGIPDLTALATDFERR